MDLTKIEWAANRQKLGASYARLLAAKKLNPALEITEAALLEDYKKNAGLVLEKKSQAELNPSPTPSAAQTGDPTPGRGRGGRA